MPASLQDILNEVKKSMKDGKKTSGSIEDMGEFAKIISVDSEGEDDDTDDDDPENESGSIITTAVRLPPPPMTHCFRIPRLQ